MSQKRLFEGDKIANMVVDMEVAKVVDMVEMELDKVADKVANKEADLMVDMARWSVLDWIYRMTLEMLWRGC